jgi:hypothetical protein
MYCLQSINDFYDVHKTLAVPLCFSTQSFFGSGDMSMPGGLRNGPTVDNLADIVCAKWG